MKLPFRFLAVFALALPLCLAQSAPPMADAGAAPPVASARQMAAPQTAAPQMVAPAEGPSKPYVIGPLDVLDIRVWNENKLSGAFPVGPDGLLNLPLIGAVKADGLTLAELNKLVTEKLTTLINSPEVNIVLGRNNSKKYYVMGEVFRPGEFPLLSDITVLDAFANCGGFKDFANPKRIYILRDNGKEKLKFNYNEVIKGKNMDQNIHLQNGDRIVVP